MDSGPLPEGLERPKRGVEHPPPISVEVEYVQSYTSHLPFVCYGRTFCFTYDGYGPEA